MVLGQIPDGIYVGRVVSFEVKVSAKKKSEFIELICQITEGDYAGRKLDAALWFSPEAFDRSIETLVECGWDTKDSVNFTGLGEIEVDLDVREEPGQEREDRPGEFYPSRTRVAFINARGATILGRRMNPMEKAEFATRILALVVKTGATAREREPKAAPTTPNNGSAIPTPATSRPALAAEPRF